ncbi:hypothetical protein CIK95_08110 [Prevotella sp. P5-108]|nr:hypothetical protein CIK95_08110 [Prevotella sp. P5-108]
MEAFQALLGDDFCFLLSPHIVARTPRKRPIMTPDHADKMEIMVVFQCPPKGRELIPAEFKDVGVLLLPLGRAGMGPVVLPFPIATIPHEKRTYPD